MHALLAGLTTLDVIHALDHEPDTTRKTTSTDHAMSAGGPATNAAVTIAALEALRHGGSGGIGGIGAGGPEARPDPRASGSAGDPAPASSVHLLTAVGQGMIAEAIASDLAGCGVRALDAGAVDSTMTTPAISSIIEHPGGRMVASTNARIEVDAERGRELLESAVDEAGAPDLVLIDGHNPALADLALGVGASPEAEEGEDPFARIDAKPSHLRILDGGSWKPWLTPLLPLVDVAVVSADFRPPLLERAEIDGLAAFLRGFGIMRVLRTRGPEPVEWIWDGARGETPVDEVEAVSTLGAGDVFHGAFAWALGVLHERGRAIPAEPSGLIAFAARIAGASTSLFGTRSWREDPRVAEAVRGFLESSEG